MSAPTDTTVFVRMASDALALLAGQDEGDEYRETRLSLPLPHAQMLFTEGSRPAVNESEFEL